MTEGNETIPNDNEQCRVFNSSLSKTVDELKIPNTSNYKLDNTIDPLKEVSKYFENHSSIANIKSKSFDGNFAFRNTSSSIVIRNGKIVWKHGPNRPFLLYNLSSEN